ncbi:hypothetical protein ADL21_20730 [Streptomyces albus subsp. albus]|nr:hypothetical protein ADL21_20730 [Streptomyces albus subsp. albus]
MIIDARGTPLAITLTAGNRHDVMHSLPLLDAIPHLKGHTGSPRQRLRQAFADRGCEFNEYRRLLGRCGIKVIARRGVPHGSKLARSIAWSSVQTPDQQRGHLTVVAIGTVQLLMMGGSGRPGAYGQCGG